MLKITQELRANYLIEEGRLFGILLFRTRRWVRF